MYERENLACEKLIDYEFLIEKGNVKENIINSASLIDNFLFIYFRDSFIVKIFSTVIRHSKRCYRNGKLQTTQPRYKKFYCL